MAYKSALAVGRDAGVESGGCAEVIVNDIELYNTIAARDEREKEVLLKTLCELMGNNGSRLSVNPVLTRSCFSAIAASHVGAVIGAGLACVIRVLERGTEESVNVMLNEEALRGLLTVVEKGSCLGAPEVAAYLLCLREILDLWLKKNQPIPRMPLEGIFDMLKRSSADQVHTELLLLMNLLVQSTTEQDIESIANALLVMVYDKLNRASLEAAFKLWCSLVELYPDEFIPFANQFADVIGSNMVEHLRHSNHCSVDAVCGLFSCLTRLADEADPEVQHFVSLFDAGLVCSYCMSENARLRRFAMIYMTKLIERGSVSPEFLWESDLPRTLYQHISDEPFHNRVVCLKLFVAWYNKHGNFPASLLNDLLGPCVVLLDGNLANDDILLFLQFLDKILAPGDDLSNSLVSLFREHSSEESLATLAQSSDPWVASSARILSDRYLQIGKV